MYPDFIDTLQNKSGSKSVFTYDVKMIKQNVYERFAIVLTSFVLRAVVLKSGRYRPPGVN